MNMKSASITASALLVLAGAALGSAKPAAADPAPFVPNGSYQIAQGPLWQPYHGEWRKMTEHGWEYRTDAPDYRPGVVGNAYGRYQGDNALWQPYNGRYRRMTEHGWEYRNDAPDYRPGVVVNNNHGYGYGGYNGYSGYNAYHGYNGYHGYGAYNNYHGYNHVNPNNYHPAFNNQGFNHPNFSGAHPNFSGGGFGHHHH